MSAEMAEVMELVQRVQRAIHRSKVLDHAHRSWVATTNLTMAQLRALMTLDDARHLTVGQLAEQLGTGMPAASSIVDRLVEEGLAERQQDPDDRRRIVVRPTMRGTERIDTMRQGPKEVVQALISRLSTPERELLVAGLRALARAAEEIQADTERQADPPPAPAPCGDRPRMASAEADKEESR